MPNLGTEIHPTIDLKNKENTHTAENKEYLR